MNNRAQLILCHLIFVFVTVYQGYAQNCPIAVTYKVSDASVGAADGSVLFQFESDPSTRGNRFTILDLTAARTGQEDRVKRNDYKVTGLKKGHYEFAIVDKQKSNCAKEVTIEIKEDDQK